MHNRFERAPVRRGTSVCFEGFRRRGRSKIVGKSREKNMEKLEIISEMVPTGILGECGSIKRT